MPMYEYRCKDCAQIFEKLVSSAASNEGQPCPECGSLNSSKLLSVFASQAGGAMRGGSSGGCGRGGCGCH